MAKAKYITDFDRDCIRWGVAKGKSVQEIATWLERSRGGIYNHIKAMEADGTLKANPQGGENNG